MPDMKVFSADGPALNTAPVELGTSRMDYARVSPEAVRAQLGLETYVRGSGLEMSLIYLVYLRASQINGCAFCVDKHSKDARHSGETEERLYATAVWRETPFFSPRERAALAWTETVTRIADTHVPDEAWADVREHFSATELMALTMAIVTINGWNRIAVSFRKPVGGYAPGATGRPPA
jgi:AhpD family alkylhydroperoxidase